MPTVTDGEDAYDPTPINEDLSGGVLAGEDENGNALFERAPKKERSQIWHGARAILSCPDDKIKFTVETSLGRYYDVFGAPVRDSGGGRGEKVRFLCLKNGHCVNRCPHVVRLQRFLQEYPEAIAA